MNDDGLIREILGEEFQTIEMVVTFYGQNFADHCQFVPNDAEPGMGFFDGVWQFPPADPPVTLEQVVQRVETVETEVDAAKRGILDLSMMMPAT